MFKNLKIILFFVVLIEITLFIIIGRLIGVLFTLLLVALTMIIGFVFIKKQSAKTIQQMQEAMQSGKMPNLDFIQHSVKTIAAILLIIPGFFTDLIGILLFIPKVRPIIIGLFSKTKLASSKKSKAKKENIIEGEYWKNNHDDDSKHLE